MHSKIWELGIIEKDLGIIVGDDLKWTGHVDRMVGKANRILSMLKRTFVSSDLLALERL